jgi:hypothetical protein
MACLEPASVERWLVAIENGLAGFKIASFLGDLLGWRTYGLLSPARRLANRVSESGIQPVAPLDR